MTSLLKEILAPENNLIDLRRIEKRKQIQKIKNSPPIFIIGSQRSGTSFLYRLIQRHLKIGFGRDNGHFIRLMKLLPYYGDLSRTDNLQRLITDLFAIPDFKKRFKGLKIDVNEFIDMLETRTYSEIIRLFYAHWAYHKKTVRWGGKTPDYAMHAATLYQLFPDAKFVHIIRDGRDVALSLFNLDWGPKNALCAARHWQERVNKALAFGVGLSNKSYMEIRYENLVQKPEAVFSHLIRFIEYEGDQEKMIRNFIAITSPKVKRDNFDKWKKKMRRKDVRIFERTAGQLLQKLGYPILNPDMPKKKIYQHHLIWHYTDNIIKKLKRGEGIAGILRKISLFRDEQRIKSNRKLKSFI